VSYLKKAKGYHASRRMIMREAAKTTNTQRYSGTSRKIGFQSQDRVWLVEFLEQGHLFFGKLDVKCYNGIVQMAQLAGVSEQSRRTFKSLLPGLTYFILPVSLQAGHPQLFADCPRLECFY
jgi:hypothetical protein